MLVFFFCLILVLLVRALGLEGLQSRLQGFEASALLFALMLRDGRSPALRKQGPFLILAWDVPPYTDSP